MDDHTWAEHYQHPAPALEAALESVGFDGPVGLAAGESAIALLRACRLLYPRVSLGGGAITFEEPELQQLVRSDGPVHVEIAGYWRSLLTLDTSTISWVSIGELLGEVPREVARAMAAMLSRTWATADMMQVDDPQAPAARQTVVSGRHLAGHRRVSAVDTDAEGPVVATAETRALSVVTMHELSTKLTDRNVIAIGAPNPAAPDLLDAQISGKYAHVFDSATGVHQPTYGEPQSLRYSRADLSAFANELRAVRDGSAEVAWLSSWPAQATPTYRLPEEGANVGHTMYAITDSSGTIAASGEYCIAISRDSSGGLIISIVEHGTSGGSSSGGRDSVRLVDFLASKLDAIVAQYPPAPGSEPTARPVVLRRGEYMASEDETFGKIFPSLKDGDGLWG